MKSEIEMQTALAGLVLLTALAPEEKDRRKAIHYSEMLLWALGYPNNFDTIFDHIKSLNLPMGDIDKEIKKIVANYKPTPDPDTHTE